MSEDNRAPEGGESAGEGKPKSKFPLWVILLIVALVCVVAVPCMAIIAAIAIPNLLASRSAAYEVASIQNLKMMATAQAQFNKRNDFYAASGHDLYATDGLISVEVASAFETNQGNNDAFSAPKAGYVYRMLLGEGGKPKSWVTGASAEGMITLQSWACSSRPAIAGNTGDNQYYISEGGVIYRQADPKTAKFLLDSAPKPEPGTGWMLAR